MTEFGTKFNLQSHNFYSVVELFFFFSMDIYRVGFGNIALRAYIYKFNAHTYKCNPDSSNIPELHDKLTNRICLEYCRELYHYLLVCHS